MTLEIGIVLGLLVIAVVVFAIEVVSVDLLTLLLLLALVGTGVLSVPDAFGGFSDEIIIILASIFVLSGALQETGVVDAVGARLVKLASGGENRLLLVLMISISGLSAFINNTTATAMFVGPVMGLARKVKVSPSKILMPIAFASILGGTCTLIGTSTNVAVSGFIVKEGLAPLGLFEMTPIGLIMVSVGIAYLVLVGKRFLPAHSAADKLAERDAIREYVSELIVLPGSSLIGQEAFKSDLARMDFRILKILRASKSFVPKAGSTIEEGDILLVTGNVENLMKVKTTEGIEIKPDWKLGDLRLANELTNIAEALVTPQSSLVGRTLKETNYRHVQGLTVWAIYRRGQPLWESIGSIPLEVGDLLLVQGNKEQLQSLQRQRELAVLAELPPSFSRRKGLFASGLFLAALLIGGLDLLPLSMSLLTATILAILFRCITIERAYQLINWRLLVLIGGMMAFGTAIDKTGADELLATWIVTGLKPLGVMAILGGFFVLTILLTQPMSNAAAALVVLPVALETARVLGVNERTVAIAIMLAASVSFIAPFEPSCLLVYGPGKYKFRDFVKTGVLLTLILAVIVLWFVPIFWPLYPSAARADP